MPNQPNKCPNCGGDLEEIDGKQCCAHCGTTYSSNNLTDLLLTAVASEYVAQKNTAHNRAKRHLSQALHEYYAQHYADCRVHLNRALEYDPNNHDANIIKSLLTKGENGRYVSTPSYKIVYAMKNWLRNKDYKHTEYVDSLFLSEISSMFPLTFFSIFQLKNMFEQSSHPNKKEYLEALQKRTRSKIIFKVVFWTLFIILVLSARSCNSSNSTKSITVTYCTSTGGTVYIPSENSRYGDYYTYHVNSGTSTYAVAVPNPGYVFSKWSDGITYDSREDIYYSSSSVTAYFKIDTTQYISLTYSANEGEHISRLSSQTIFKKQQWFRNYYYTKLGI